MREAKLNINIKGYISLLSKYLKKHYKLVVLLVLTTLFSLIMTLVKPKILSLFVDSVSNKTVEQLLKLGILFLIAELISAALTIFMQYITENLGWSTTNDLRIDLTKHLLNMDMSFHKKFSAGTLIVRIDGDIQNLFNFFTTLITGITFNSIIILGSMIYLGILDFRFFLIELIAMIAFSIYMISIRKPVNKYSNQEMEALSVYAGQLSEQVTSIEEIRSFRLQNWVKNKNRKVFREDFSAWAKNMHYEFLSWSVMSLLSTFAYVSSFILGAYLVYNYKITLGSAFSIFYILGIMWSPLNELRANLQYMQSAEAAIKRINELLEYNRELSNGQEVFPKNSSIEVKNLYFAYEDDLDNNILKNVSFKLNSGEKLGILGRTGSGKTTLAKLIVKFHDPLSGEILIDNTNIKEISDDELRKNISYLTQEIQFFNSSVRNNLTLFKKNITDEKIMSVIKELGLGDWFKKLPDGLDTEISDDSTFFSTGEMQLLTVLRMFLKDPKIIVLDEATAKLDPVTEKYLQKSLDLLMKGRTTIIIAHRLKTILETDKILILDDGLIIESGETNTLKNSSNSKFYSLLQTGLEEVLK